MREGVYVYMRKRDGDGIRIIRDQWFLFFDLGSVALSADNNIKSKRSIITAK